MDDKDISPPAVRVESTDDTPVKRISSSQLRSLGQELGAQFKQYSKDRDAVEQKWLRNLRQYLGVYDPEIEQQLASDRSRAYPRLTRVKCISTESRVMNLMFPGNEKNWTLKASPSAEMSPQDVMMAVQDAQKRDQSEGIQTEMTPDYVEAAVQEMADKRAMRTSRVIDDQLQELGGGSGRDYIHLVREVVKSGTRFGVGFLTGPYVKETKTTAWTIRDGAAEKRELSVFKPHFEFMPVWDVYPDMSAKSLYEQDGYFTRKVVSKTELRKLGRRDDFFEDVIKNVISMYPQGTFKEETFEQELKSMGTKSNIQTDGPSAPSKKYAITIWNGPVDADTFEAAGIDVPEKYKSDFVEAEVWLVGDHVVKADVSPWYKMGVEQTMLHSFMFDDDDTSPVGNGLPNVVRDSQMSICAATRMLLDNASVTCGPQIVVNMDLLRPDQDVTTMGAYKIWQRDGDSGAAGSKAVENVSVDSHMTELMQIIEMFMAFADMETFVGPATGGDMQRAPSEPMRTAAGASMLRGEAALPFKDIVRNFDSFTQSVISSMVWFNRKFNPALVPAGDYNVIARGATSLIAKEVRGAQLDQIAATLRPGEEIHVDERKLVEQRFGVRDMEDLLVSNEEAKRREKVNAQKGKALEDIQMQQLKAEVRNTLADAFKAITQGQKNAAVAEAQTVSSALDIMEKGIENDLANAEANAQGPAGAVAQVAK